MQRLAKAEKQTSKILRAFHVQYAREVHPATVTAMASAFAYARSLLEQESPAEQKRVLTQNAAVGKTKFAKWVAKDGVKNQALLAVVAMYDAYLTNTNSDYLTPWSVFGGDEEIECQINGSGLSQTLALDFFTACGVVRMLERHKRTLKLSCEGEAFNGKLVDALPLYGNCEARVEGVFGSVEFEEEEDMLRFANGAAALCEYFEEDVDEVLSFEIAGKKVRWTPKRK